jgi:hypothetical protein
VTSGQLEPDLPVTSEHRETNLPVTSGQLEPDLPVTSEHRETNLPVTSGQLEPDLPVTSEQLDTNLPVTSEFTCDVRAAGARQVLADLQVEKDPVNFGRKLAPSSKLCNIQ